MISTVDADHYIESNIDEGTFIERLEADTGQTHVKYLLNEILGNQQHEYTEDYINHALNLIDRKTIANHLMGNK